MNMMNPGKENKQKPIKGVVCDVVNCQYNDGDGSCRAKQISVGPICASACTDTVCATFKLRENVAMMKRE